MLGIILESNDPFFNLAAEDYLLHSRKENFVILSINDPSVIIGKHQVAHREVNTRFIEENRIPLIRRISGGGTVYHDRGNLNFAFVRQSESGKQVDFRLYTQPVINFLQSVGIPAVFQGKNDLTLDGFKISGNAEHVFRERVLHHGTLLFDASLNNLRRSLKPKSDIYQTRGVESNRSPVANLKERLKSGGDISAFANCMFEYLASNMDGMQRFTFTSEEITSIKALSESKYQTWEWNYGYGPPYTLTLNIQVSGEACLCRMLVKDGIIWSCDIEGSNELTAAAKKLIGVRHMYNDVLKVFRDENIPISDEEVYKLF